MKYTLSFCLILTLFFCKENNQTQLFEGNIFITLINVYDVNKIIPENEKEEFRKNIIAYNLEGKSESEREMFKFYKTLMDHNLFDKSNFQIKLKNNEIINVYVNEKEYLKLEKELKNLDTDTEQIKVKLSGLRISDGVFNRAMYSADEIISVEKTSGKTEWKK